MKESYVLENIYTESVPQIPWVTFLLLAILFFLIEGHNIFFSLVEHYDQSEEVFETMTEEGNPLRRLAMPLLGLFAVITLFRQGFKNLQINGVRGWVVIFFIVFTLASILWSIESGLTSRRLLVFIIFWLTALAFANRYWVTAIPYLAFFISSMFVIAGLMSELALGTFNPANGNYRFMGTMHPNIQAINCAIMFISAITIYHGVSKGKLVYLGFALAALLFLFLTKSRTSFAGAMIVVSVLYLISTPFTLKKGLAVFTVLSVAIGGGFLLLNLGSENFTILSSGVNLGREATDVNSLNGRMQIWALCWEYIEKRLFIGYGYDSFWNVQNIYTLSLRLGWGLISAHNAYFEMMLGVGLMGTAAYLAISIISMRKAFTEYKNSGNIGYAFHILLLSYFMLQGFTESVYALLSFGTFLLLCGFVNIAFLPSEREESPDINWISL